MPGTLPPTLTPADLSVPKTLPLPPSKDIVAKLQWLMFFRVMMITVLFGSTIAVNVNETEFFSDRSTLTLFALIIGTYGLTIIYAVLLKRIKRHVLFARVQLIGDLLITTVLVFLTGGADSAFLFMYSLTVMNAALLLFRAGALLTATVSAVLLVIIMGREAAGLGHQPEPYSGAAARGLFLSALANVIAVYLVALLSGYLGEQLRDAGQRLKLAGEDLKQLRALNQHVITSIKSGLVCYLPDGRVIFINPAAERITGIPADEALGRNIHEIFPGLASHLPAVGGRLNRWEDTYVAPGGRRLTLGFSVSPLLDAQGVAGGSVMIFQDLTKHREREAIVRRNDKFAAIGMMAAGLAHELRNPLASISGSVEMLSRSHELDADDQRLMNIVLREIDRLNTLVTDFLDFAGGRPPQRERLDARPFLDEVVQIFRQRSDGRAHEVQLDVPEGLVLEADPAQLKQVVWNLLNNASQAMPMGGLIEVTAGHGGEPDESLEQSMVEIRIRDQGVGMSTSVVAKIFDPFFTTKSRGTGLGLALVHRIIQDHGGRLRVISAPGEGSTFVVMLPSGAGAT